MMANTDIDDIVYRMKESADNLIDYTFPISSFETEQAVNIFKQRVIRIDGYEVAVYYSRASYEDSNGHYFLDTLQMRSYITSFLPFNVVCKLARIFLGSEHLLYVDFVKDSKRVYTWTARIVNDVASSINTDSQPMKFEDFEFRVVTGNKINIA